MGKNKNKSNENTNTVETFDMSGLTEAQKGLIDSLPDENKLAVIDQLREASKASVPVTPMKATPVDPDQQYRETDLYSALYDSQGGGRGSEEADSIADELAICAVIAKQRREETGTPCYPDTIALERREAGTVQAYASKWGLRPGFVLDVSQDSNKMSRTFLCGYGFEREGTAKDARPNVSTRVLHIGHTWTAKDGTVNLKMSTTVPTRLAGKVGQYLSKFDASGFTRK